MDFNEENMINILSKGTKPISVSPVFVIIDEYESKIKNSMFCPFPGKEGKNSTATSIKQSIKVFNNG